jgi:thimet oligopeptidase
MIATATKPMFPTIGSLRTMSRDLPPYSQLTPEVLDATCHAAVLAAYDRVRDIIAVPIGQRTYLNTLQALEDAEQEIAEVRSAWTFPAYVTADDALRRSALTWEKRLEQYLIDLRFDEGLHSAIREFAASAAAAELVGEESRLLAHTLRDYRRKGFAQPKDTRVELRGLFHELAGLESDFRRSVAESEDWIEVDRDGLRGLPESFITGLDRIGNRYRVSISIPERDPFLANADAEHWRRRLMKKDLRKGGTANVTRLERMIAIRSRIAGLLGYESWAEYATEPQMTGDSRTVAEFLRDLRANIESLCARDTTLLLGADHAAAGSREIPSWNLHYLLHRSKQSMYAVDDLEVAQYLPLDACLDGLLNHVAGVFGVRCQEAGDASAWHPEVRVFDLVDAADDHPLAHLYLDLFPRPNKYRHAATFTLRTGRRLPDGTHQRPAVAIVANVTRPSQRTPALLRHSELVTLFHEFGHTLHKVVNRSAQARFADSRTEFDFREVPAQVLERMCWSPDVLRLFTGHHVTGAPLPEELLARMVAAKNLGAGLLTLRRIFFASLDLAYHRADFDGDSTATLNETGRRHGFTQPPGTYLQAGLVHLVQGYAGLLYSYLWSNVLADDIYTEFERSGAADRNTGARLRETVLARGGTVSAHRLVRDFLGREPNSEAFLRNLEI